MWSTNIGYMLNVKSLLLEVCVLSVGDGGDDMGGILFLVQHTPVGHVIQSQMALVQRLGLGHLLGGVGHRADLRVVVGSIDILG